VSAGLPGLGLGGLFFIVSALLAPLGQVWRVARGRSLPGEWRVVGRQFAQAVTMVIAIDLTLRLVYLALARVGVGDAPSAVSATVLPLKLIGITSGLLAVVLVLAKLGELRQRRAGGDGPRIPPRLPRPRPGRALASGTAVVVAWVALLSVGAAELSPLSRPDNHAAPTERLDATAELQPAAPPGRDVKWDLDGPAADVAHEAAETATHASHPESGSGRGAVSPGSASQPSVTRPSVSASAPSGAGAPGGAPGSTSQPVGETPSANPPSQAADAATPSGPPTSTGPSEDSHAPEGAGPPEEPGPPEHADHGKP
jgi:hypothetical protein